MRIVRLQQIDDLTRPDHHYLASSDRVYYLREYTSRVGFSHSETNQLILNLKKPMDRRGTPEWRYKAKAIDTLALELRAAIPHPPAGAIWVPVPPSKVAGDPLYDDRLRRILDIAFPNATKMELVVQRTSVAASHHAEHRPSPDDLRANYRVDTSLSPQGRNFLIFDDILTTGCHFKAVQSMLEVSYPGASCVGVCLARRIFPED